MSPIDPAGTVAPLAVEALTVPAFDVCGLLPSGVTVLEASAGTGKTFTIAGLAARFVAAGIPLEQLLLVTFTRMATGELRDRVRRRLFTAEHGLARALAGVAPPEGDDVLTLLATGSTEELARRRRRLASALADFDAATIATTHGFCQHVLQGLGVAGDVELDVTFTEDVSDLRDEVVDDLYLRKFHRRGGPPFSRAEAGRIAEVVVANPDAALQPRTADPDSTPAMRVRLAVAVRGELERRKRQAAVLTYDDLLTRLRQTLADDARGAAACRRLRSRYRVALVDEFQDTDPVQWDIMRRVFASGDATLVLIGDPKQAIYSFRGADIYAYLQAVHEAGTQATLGINWRSDQALVDACDALFGGSKLGHEGIAYRTVRAADANQPPRLLGAPEPAALRVRIVRRVDGHVPLTPKGFLSVQGARDHIAADLATDVVRLVSSGAQIVDRSEEGAERGRAARPGHVAVLVARHRDAALVRDALEAVGVPAVINGAGSVFATPIATEWLRLLEALERPTATNPAHGAALSVFLGWTAEQVASADDEAWENVHARLHRWAGVLRRHGVASLLETITLAERLPGRMLVRVDGERRLTDLRHVAQLLHAEATSEQLGVTALTGWLRQRIADAGDDSDAEDRARRLESDAEAVQVLTIHRSKGLEFPVVYCPYLWDPGWIRSDEPPVYHDAEAGDRRTIDVGGPGPGFGGHKRQHALEQRGEELRLAYVALTRARHQVVLWWAPSWDSQDSPLGRLMFARDEHGTVATDGNGDGPPPDDDAAAAFGRLGASAPACISVERSDGGDGRIWTPGAGVPADLRVGHFGRRLDARWRRTSYSGITSDAHEARVSSEVEEPLTSDEAVPPRSGPIVDHDPAREDADSEEARLRAVRSRLAAMPAGADVGTLVHGVLEHTDFTTPDLEGELARAVAREQTRRHVDTGDPAIVAAGLRAAIETPLGPLVGDVALRQVGVADRIDELSFELPLAGGDTPTAEISLGQIREVLAEHLPAGDLLAGYASRLDDPSLHGDLRGYLSGSLDVVLRITRNGTPRFAVVDYKTNWLGGDGEDLSAWHYRPTGLVEAMDRSHYPLQAMLYIVALHRYLRWRLPGYRAERNLAGVLYLFLRGMVGPATPRVDGQPCGVFAWRPPGAMVEALSDLFDRAGALDGSAQVEGSDLVDRGPASGS